MHVAEVLSDLDSLYLADPKAASELVKARVSEDNIVSNSETKESDDPDLKRARDLLELHAEVKVAHKDGTNQDLLEARQAVESVMKELQ